MINQVCHASVDILMECLPSGGYGFPSGSALGEHHPPSGRHSIRIPTLAWHICILDSHTCQLILLIFINSYKVKIHVSYIYSNPEFE